MKLTQSQKVFVVVLCVALAGLTAERVLFAPRGVDASADDATLAPGALIAASNLNERRVPSVAAANARVAHELPARLRAVATERSLDIAAVDDPFAVPKHWLPDVPFNPIDPVEPRSLADEFVERHALKAVMAGSSGGYAMINDKALRLGDTLDGYQIVEIGTRSVILECDGVRVELSLLGSP